MSDSYYLNNKLLRKVYILWKNIYNKLRLFYKNDKKRIERRFFRKFGYKLNLQDPKTLNEKIQWLKVYDRTPLHTICADKYDVRAFIEKKLSNEFLIPLHNVYNNANQLIPENLPNTPFIIKTTHDSGTNFIIKEKEKQDWNKIRNTIDRALLKNYYYYTQEWQYKNIKPRIIIEELLEGKNNEVPYDYKVHCFSGKAEMISVDISREKSMLRNWYDTKWNQLDFKWSSTIEASSEKIEKPTILDLMIKNSEIISKSFCYVRIDWYVSKNKLYFGEVTFHHGSGIGKFEPENLDYHYGNKVILPKKTI